MDKPLYINFKELEKKDFYSEKHEINPEKCWFSGVVAVYHYNGIPFTGIAFELNRQGKIISEITYIDGSVDGFFRYWYPQGLQIHTEGFHSKVKTRIISTKDNNTGKYPQRYGGNCRTFDGHYRIFDGERKIWHHNGQLNELSYFNDGFFTKFSKVWDEKGNLISETSYDEKGNTTEIKFHFPGGGTYQKF